MTDLTSTTDLKDLVSKANVLVVGPGLGREQFSRRVLGNVLDFRSSEQALVLDADALVCLAEDVVDVAGAILTPHPGEAATLLSTSVKDVQHDRFAAAQAIARKYNSICILKGAGTVISDGKVFHVCDRGGPELATAGTGDVLAGMIAAFVANGMESLNASILAVFIHSLAGELCVQRNGNGLVASDLFRQIPAALTRLDQ